MARYRGPRVKICRALNTVIPGLTSKPIKRKYPPGVHGLARRPRPSDYKIRLQEKQKLRYHYGVLEKQFKRYVREAARRKGPTGSNLISMLESRLDNIIYRIGLAPSLPAARQMVVHGHITLDGHRVDRPSYNVNVGQVIGLHQRTKRRCAQFLEERSDLASRRQRPSYLEFNEEKLEAKLVVLPRGEDIPFEVNTQLVVEFYSQQM